MTRHRWHLVRIVRSGSVVLPSVLAFVSTLWVVPVSVPPHARPVHFPLTVTPQFEPPLPPPRPSPRTDSPSTYSPCSIRSSTDESVSTTAGLVPPYQGEEHPEHRAVSLWPDRVPAVIPYPCRPLAPFQSRSLDPPGQVEDACSSGAPTTAMRGNCHPRQRECASWPPCTWCLHLAPRSVTVQGSPLPSVWWSTQLGSRRGTASRSPLLLRWSTHRTPTSRRSLPATRASHHTSPAERLSGLSWCVRMAALLQHPNPEGT